MTAKKETVSSFQKLQHNVIGVFAMTLVILFSANIAFAASATYSTYYSMHNACYSQTHNASATPTVTITTSNMVGTANEPLWVEIDKKYVYGWAAPGSGNSSKKVSSTIGSTFKLTGNGSGDYRLLFMKYSCVVNGDYSTTSKKWYSDLTIKYNH